jgi:hypothetical protein
MTTNLTSIAYDRPWKAPASSGLSRTRQQILRGPGSLHTIGCCGRAKGGPTINTTNYSLPIYAVPADQPTVTLALEATLTAPVPEET